MTSLLGRIAGAAARTLHPSMMWLLVDDWRRGLRVARPGKSERNLDATMDWLRRAQDQAGGRGVSAGYSLRDGWWPPYPETTGYIIPTFFDYAAQTGQDDFRDRAIRMAEWEIEILLPSGAVRGGLYRPQDRRPTPVVFNTGQVILGWCRAFDETADARFLDAAVRAAGWLTEQQSSDGSWGVGDAETETRVHAYDVRTAWSLLEVHRRSHDARVLEAAIKNVEWTLSQQQENGWFNNNAFFLSADRWNRPFTHQIAYVMEGLLEASRLTGDPRCFEAVKKTAERLMHIFEVRRLMPGEFDSNWKSNARFSCLTGDAQISGVWLRLFERTRDARYLNAALKLNDYVKGSQRLHSLHPGIRGGVKGSQPFSGRYTRFVFVNWGAKFLADALMLELRLMPLFEQEILGTT